MKIKIIPADIADCADIANVQIRSYRRAFAPFFPKAYIEHFTEKKQTQDWRDLMSDPKREPLYVAKNDAREIVGYALGKTHPTGSDATVGELEAIHVLSEYQHQGFGSDLFVTVALDLKQRGKRSLTLWALEGNPVRAWYARLNGKLVNSKSYDVDEMKITRWHKCGMKLTC